MNAGERYEIKAREHLESSRALYFANDKLIGALALGNLIP